MADDLLTNLSDVKLQLKLTTNVDDQLLSNLIKSGSDFVEGWINRKVMSASYTTQMDGTGSAVMVLPNYPVTAVSSFKINGTEIAQSAGWNSPGYLFDYWSIRLRSYTFVPGQLNCEVTYTAGYLSVPHDIEQACIDLICRKYRSLDRIGLTSKGLAGETTAYTQSDMSADTKAMLNQYRRFTP